MSGTPSGKSAATLKRQGDFKSDDDSHELNDDHNKFEVVYMVVDWIVFGPTLLGAGLLNSNGYRTQNRSNSKYPPPTRRLESLKEAKVESLRGR
jgi:hypothetical protein